MSSISAVQAGSQDIVRIIEALRTLSEGLGTTSVVTVDRVLALLTVAHYTNTNGSIDQNELAGLNESSASTMSRNVAALSDIGDRGREPLHMVQVRLDPADRRRRLVSTTTKGESLVNKAVGKLRGQ